MSLLGKHPGAAPHPMAPPSQGIAPASRKGAQTAQSNQKMGEKKEAKWGGKGGKSIRWPEACEQLVFCGTWTPSADPPAPERQLSLVFLLLGKGLRWVTLQQKFTQRGWGREGGCTREISKHGNVYLKFRLK